jgi:hypothetical protein
VFCVSEQFQFGAIQEQSGNSTPLPYGKPLLFEQADQIGSDLMLVENFK